MTLIARSIRQRDKPASLSIQVMHAERQVLDRRRLVIVRASALGVALRSQMSSPAMLLWAGGLGFAAAEFTRRQASLSGDAKRPRSSWNKLFGKAIKFIALVRTLSRFLPSADRDLHPFSSP